MSEDEESLLEEELEESEELELEERRPEAATGSLAPSAQQQYNTKILII